MRVVTKDAAQQSALSLLFRVYTSGEACETLVDEVVEPYGVADGFVTMSLLSRSGSLTPTEISRRLGMRLTTTSALVRRLVERGHARQVPNPRDGRSQLVTLTEEGSRAIMAAFPAFFETMEAVENHLSRSVEEVYAALDDLEQAFRAVREERLERDRTGSARRSG
jgi:DNA-binding MarR family transcriptional regulator